MCKVMIIMTSIKFSFSSVQSLTHVQLFVTPWFAACQVSLPITNSQSLLKFISIESVMPSKFSLVQYKCVCAKPLQSYPTLCDPMHCGSPGSPVHGILQIRILEWVAMPFSMGFS